MKESAQAALSYVRSHGPELGIDDDYFQTHDLHIHVPAGAIPKDGPSAGVTMASAICSLVTGTPVNSDVAMTGEITLTGQVLPIGGLKEKTLAAQRAGITTVILPSRNEADLEDVPEELRQGMTFVPVDRIEEVWKAAMGLKLDMKALDLAEARELLEEAGELIARAHGKAAAVKAATTDGARPAPPKPAASRRPGRQRQGHRQGRRGARQGRGEAGNGRQGRAQAEEHAGAAEGRRQEDHGRTRSQRAQALRLRRQPSGATTDRAGRGATAPRPARLACPSGAD